MYSTVDDETSEMLEILKDGQKISKKEAEDERKQQKVHSSNEKLIPTPNMAKTPHTYTIFVKEYSTLDILTL